MIKINKSESIPSVLTGVDASNARNAIDSIIQNGGTPEEGDFKSKVYNGVGVKFQLLADQKKKCAYCEVSMAGDFGAVEHYRPKTGWKENDGDALHTPGYHWLAYDWSNLLCSCDKCNSAARKGNLFPLRVPVTRDIPNRNISQEEPLIVNPTTEDPGQFIRFNEYMATPATNDGTVSDKGKRTIEIFDLNGCVPKKSTPARTDLKEARRRRWLEAKALFDSYISNGISRSDAIVKVKLVYAVPEKDFAGMFIYQDRWFL